MLRRTATTLASIGALLGAVLATGCAGEPKHAGESALSTEDPAPDFMLAVTVHAQPGADASHLPRSLRPARYVMEADWILRAAMGAGVSDETFPPRTRQLTAPQVLRLWQDLRDSGLVDETPEAAGTDLVYTIYFAGGGVRRALKLDRDSYPGAQRLVDDMAALAWVQE